MVVTDFIRATIFVRYAFPFLTLSADARIVGRAIGIRITSAYKVFTFAARTVVIRITFFAYAFAFETIVFLTALCIFFAASGIAISICKK